MSNVAKVKITGWTMAWCRKGVLLFVTVQTRTRKEAIARFNEAGMKVIDCEQVKPVTIIPEHQEIFAEAKELDASTCLPVSEMTKEDTKRCR